MLMVFDEFTVAQGLSHDEASEHSEEVLGQVACIAAEANSRLTASVLADLFPLVRACEDSVPSDTTWFRSADAPIGVDGGFRIDLGQLVDFSISDAVVEVRVQAERFVALQRLSGMIEEARERLDAEFAGFQTLMRLHEVAIVTEDDEPQLLAEFSMLDDELAVRKTRRVSHSLAALIEEVRYAASWHNHRLAILWEKRANKCSLFIDACAQAAIAWAGLSISNVLTQVTSESWISVPLLRGDVRVATAMLYIANCVLTAEIHSAADDWHLRGADLVLREGLSCPDCIRRSGLQDLMKLLPPLQRRGAGESQAPQWTEEGRNGVALYSTLNVMRTPLFPADSVQSLVALKHGS